MNYLIPMTTEKISAYAYPENLTPLFVPSERSRDIDEYLYERNQAGKKYAVLGIPEGIGPVANRGRPGAEGAWEAFLKYLPSTWQDNSAFAEQVLILGQVQVEDLMETAALENYQSITNRNPLRKLVRDIDRRSAPIIQSIFEANLIPVVVGGGHNNAYPLLREAASSRYQMQRPGLACINIDLHADLRAKEGRHSGNAFTYALDEGFLGAYYIFGLYELYHSETYLRRIQQLRAEGIVDYSPYHRIMQNLATSFQTELSQALKFIKDFNHPVGLEVDLDSVEAMPASAITEVRLPLSFVHQAVSEVARQTPTMYLNISEGAPALAKRDGDRLVGHTINRLILDYIKANNTE